MWPELLTNPHLLAGDTSLLFDLRFSPARIRAVSGASDSTAAELEKLAALKEKGVLTEAEFTAQKAKILGS
jgi:hypothetical protein